VTAPTLGKDIAWFPSDLEDEDRWIHQLSEAEKADIEGALRTAQSQGASIRTLTRELFPLTVLPATLQMVRDRIENDLGLYVLRGLPVERYSKDELRLIYWGVGLHLGTAVSQSSKGDFLGDVRNVGDKVDDDKGRGYMSKDLLGFHTDTADVVALLVLRTAQSGGRSMFCSSVAIRDEIAATRPDLYEVLQQPFYWSWKGQEADGELPYYQQPIFSEYDGRFSSRWIGTHILTAQELPGVPPLTPLQREAMTLVNALANEPRFHTSMMFEPGDFQFLNNHVVYHARTEFVDWPEPDRRRHLLRMWLAVPNSRQLAESMTAIYIDPTAGAVRGGFASRVDQPVYETKIPVVE